MQHTQIFTEMYTKFIPVWVCEDGSVGRGFPHEMPDGCEEFFERRVAAGLKDESYKIEIVKVHQFMATTQPNKANEADRPSSG